MTQQGGILLMELSTLVKMSNTYGSNPAYVLAGGGNTSVKDDTTLYVKGSGTQLATIKAEEFVKMDRARLNEIMKTEYPSGWFPSVPGSASGWNRLQQLPSD